MESHASSSFICDSNEGTADLFLWSPIPSSWLTVQPQANGRKKKKEMKEENRTIG